jgi:hypothetical protein
MVVPPCVHLPKKNNHLSKNPNKSKENLASFVEPT